MINKSKTLLFFSLYCLSFFCFPDEKAVACRIEITAPERALYKGDCEIHREGGGTFTLWAPHPESHPPIFEDMSTITVFVIDRGRAKVSGMTTDGIQNSWGDAIRSKADTGCWNGTDFQICAWRR